jgi:hypothetical protein
VTTPLAIGTLFLFSSLALGQAATESLNHSTLKHPRHKVSCLCGVVQICSGDICLTPESFDLDDDITVELRDKSGVTILDSKKVVMETRAIKGTMQDGIKTTSTTRERRFCFENKPDGNYFFAFVLYKNGAPQPAERFPVNYVSRRRKRCDSVYVLDSPHS